ncbi:MAG TPA: hypothetical protein VHX19_20390 [Stellaceae bacterium]|jgi:hypothetical protein|nr:hypothetical protein [Stellaceae bacterium]
MIFDLNFLRRAAMPILLAVSLSACAVGRSEIEINAPVSAPPANARAFAKIVAVDDLRQFAAAPRDPSIPSLASAADINNKAITGRAVARKRGGMGMALGDIVLPEGKTVAGLVRAAAQKALQEKGYAVVDEASPQYANARPLRIAISDFWSWLSPGFASLSTEFKATLLLNGDALVGPGTVTVNGYVRKENFVVTESVWTKIIQEGTDELSNEIAAKIKPAAGM